MGFRCCPLGLHFRRCAIYLMERTQYALCVYVYLCDVLKRMVCDVCSISEEDSLKMLGFL